MTQSENDGERHVERLPLLPGIRSYLTPVQPSLAWASPVVLVDVLVRRRRVLIARWAPPSSVGSLSQTGALGARIHAYRCQEFITGPQKEPLVLQRTDHTPDRAETLFEG